MQKLADERARGAMGAWWTVSEQVQDSADKISAVWTRRGESYVFDAVWVDGKTGKSGTDVLRVHTWIAANEILTVEFDAQDSLKKYAGYVRHEGDRAEGRIYFPPSQVSRDGRWEGSIHAVPPDGGVPFR